MLGGFVIIMLVCEGERVRVREGYIEDISVVHVIVFRSTGEGNV